MSKPNRAHFYKQPNRKCQYATPEEEQQARQAVVEEQFKIVHSLFPEVNSIPHMDTLARVLEKISVEEIEQIIGETVKKLIHNKKFQRMVADGSYVIAVDGTQKWATDWEFSPEALHKTYGGRTKYQVYVLEAALVGPKGVVIPLMSEFCENPPDAGEQTKQDCEIKAFYRLAQRLKSLFPKQHLMITADGLYPTGPVMGLCRNNHWDFMIVLPSEIKLSDLQREAKAIRDLEHGQRLNYTWGDRNQDFSWANGIKYTWKDTNGNYLFLCRPAVE